MAFVAPSPAAEHASTRPIEVQIEVEVEPTRPPDPRVEAPATRVEAPRNDETPQARTERPANAPSIEPAPGPIPTGAPTAEPQASGATVVVPTVPGPAATSEYDGPPPAVVMGPAGGLPGMGQSWSNMPGVIPEMGRPPPAPTTSPKATVDPNIATKVLKEAMKEKDKGLGLDSPARGAVATAVRGVVQSVDVPAESKGTFEIRLSPAGTVVSVRVSSSAGGSADLWARAAKAVQAALAGRVLTLSSDYANGAVVSVTAQSMLVLPDGTKSAIQQKGAGATFDLANIGAHMQKSVRTTSSIVAVK